MASELPDFGRIARVLERLPGELRRTMRVAAKQSGIEMQAAMFERFTGYSNPRTSEDKLQSRNAGGLRGATNYVLSGDFGSPEPLSLRVFVAGKNYANIQEFGGEVTPKRGRYLTIPIADNLTPAGRVRYPSAADLRDRYPGLTYFVKSKKGSLLLFAKGKPGARVPEGKKPKPQLLFVLVTKAKIPPRLGFRSTWKGLNASRIRRISAAFGEAVQAARAGA